MTKALAGFQTKSEQFSSSVAEQYIYESTELPFQYLIGSGYVDMPNIPLGDFTRPPRVIFNTYLLYGLSGTEGIDGFIYKRQRHRHATAKW